MNIRFLLRVFFVVATSLSTVPLAYAATIGYVDARRVIDKAPQSEVELEKLKIEFFDRKEKLNTEIEAFKKDEEELIKNSVLLSTKELDRKTSDLRDSQRNLQRAQREYNEDYAQKRNETLSQLETLISEVVVAIAKKKKLDIIFQQAIYASPSIDLTDDVLEALKKQHKK